MIINAKAEAIVLLTRIENEINHDRRAQPSSGRREKKKTIGTINSPAVVFFVCGETRIINKKAGMKRETCLTRFKERVVGF